MSPQTNANTPLTEVSRTGTEDARSGTEGLRPASSQSDRWEATPTDRHPLSLFSPELRGTVQECSEGVFLLPEKQGRQPAPVPGSQSSPDNLKNERTTLGDLRTQLRPTAAAIQKSPGVAGALKTDLGQVRAWAVRQRVHVLREWSATCTVAEIMPGLMWIWLVATWWGSLTRDKTANLIALVAALVWAGFWLLEKWAEYHPIDTRILEGVHDWMRRPESWSRRLRFGVKKPIRAVVRVRPRWTGDLHTVDVRCVAAPWGGDVLPSIVGVADVTVCGNRWIPTPSVHTKINGHHSEGFGFTFDPPLPVAFRRPFYLQVSLASNLPWQGYLSIRARIDRHHGHSVVGLTAFTP